MLPTRCLVLVVLTLARPALAAAPPDRLPGPRAMAAALTDVWAEAAMRRPEGPRYEFFAPLLPPLRWVNTDFRHHPVVLCAPGAPVKARWVSNGSAVNARANKPPMWKEAGFPVHFYLGERGTAFTADGEPHYAEGYLPIVQVACTEGMVCYQQEVFAPVRGVWAAHGTVFVRFTARGARGEVAAHLPGEGKVRQVQGCLQDERGHRLVALDSTWSWDERKKTLRARLEPGKSASLAVLTQAMLGPLPTFHQTTYADERKACGEVWNALLARGMRLEIPERIVQDAWRALVIGNFLIAVGDRMHYSAGNAYDRLYIAECGDAVRALLLLGFLADTRRMLGPLLAFERKATRYHVAGHKLQLLEHYWWITRDNDTWKETEPIWKGVAEFLCASRRTENGLLPKDNYAGDIPRQVHALNSNANAWRGLRDLAVILGEQGRRDLAQRYAREAEAFRASIMKAVAKSEKPRSGFIPNALLDDEEPPRPITATRLGSYYNLMAPYILGSGIFPPGSPRERWLLDYPRNNGGLAMGMVRSTPHQGQFKGEPGVNVLYGLRRMLAELRQDERDRALAGFYGQLAQGMTRGTFLGGEGSRFFHGGPGGRSFYLPPNSASNAMFLTTLRYLLVQEWDLNDDGRPETLRLLYGAPGHWFRDGAVLRAEKAPSAFGPLSLVVESHLSRGVVRVSLTLPPRRPARLLLRLPLPAGWRVTAACVGDTAMKLGRDGSVDLSERSGRVLIRFTVESRQKAE